MSQVSSLWRAVAGLCVATALATPCYGVLGAQSAPPRAPDGLWWDPQKGAVVRMGACGSGADGAPGPWCGVLVGLPAEKPKDGAAPRCGSRLFHNFTWDARQQRFVGRLSPPEAGRTISATARVTPDSMLVSARVLFMSRTLLFVRYPGTVAAGCAPGTGG